MAHWTHQICQSRFASDRPIAYSWARKCNGPEVLSTAAANFLHRVCPMALKNLVIGACCLVLFGGAFAARFVFLHPKSRTAADLPAVGPAQLDGEPANKASDDVAKPAGSDPQPKPESAKNSSTPTRRATQPPKEAPKKPLTCVEATKLGADSVGKR